MAPYSLNYGLRRIFIPMHECELGKLYVRMERLNPPKSVHRNKQRYCGNETRKNQQSMADILNQEMRAKDLDGGIEFVVDKKYGRIRMKVCGKFYDPNSR